MVLTHMLEGRRQQRKNLEKGVRKHGTRKNREKIAMGKVLEWKGHGPGWGKAHVKVSCPEKGKGLRAAGD